MKIELKKSSSSCFLGYAWFLEGVTVYDMHGKRIFQFPCERWLSGQDGDKRTYRILQVDRERDFIDGK